MKTIFLTEKQYQNSDVFNLLDFDMPRTKHGYAIIKGSFLQKIFNTEEQYKASIIA